MASEVAMDELLRRLEVMTVTRSSLPALLSVEAEPGLWVRAHGSELLRGLSNVVENAIEASARATPGSGPWTVDVRALASADTVVIEVRDHGDGFPESVTEWLARPPGEGEVLGSSKADGGLHGIGLRVARRVAEEVGGRLEAASHDGTTVVRLVLPRVVKQVPDTL
jgi:C4-dicarboxylate-specific signal transduction histidine kinase